MPRERRANVPADPATYCPVCGLFWYVHGCKPGKCRTPRVVVIPAEGADFKARRNARLLSAVLNAPENRSHALRVIEDRKALAMDLALHGVAAWDKDTGQRLVLFPPEGD